MSDKDKGRQKAAQFHAEGQHGGRTRAQWLKQIHTSPPDERDNIIASNREGKHRLAEDRDQHDIAEKVSEAVHRDDVEEG